MTMRNVEASVIVSKPPALVLSVFTEYRHLHIWWNVERALIDLGKAVFTPSFGEFPRKACSM